MAQENQAGMNNPYVDDKIIHFGFSLGTNLMAFGVHDSNIPIADDGTPITDPSDPRWAEAELYHARVSSLMPGFSVGFIMDVRLCQYLNLRFTPTLHFSNRTISYKAHSGKPVKGTPGHGSTAEVLSLPIDIPLYLKFSARREHNYRPYVIAGGGFSYNVSRDKEKVLMLSAPDWFVGIGFGVDIYLPWFKLAPEIRYQIGFQDALDHNVNKREGLQKPDYFYTRAIDRLSNHMVTISFNFE